jgi:hypothetical protein
MQFNALIKNLLNENNIEGKELKEFVVDSKNKLHSSFDVEN